MTPVHAAARSLCILQVLIGVLYPVALLGWLVSLFAHQNQQPPAA
ncbi:MAG: hypothetical protein Q8S12_19610 [Hydrogenophaga sp.]|nr:hypothetical protein [Hydrogenophaga sp.]MDP3628792.1 hypothetical protein [Hydrogenophaga sp.]